MLSLASSVETTSHPRLDTVRNDIIAAAAQASESIAYTTMDSNTVYRLPVCADVSDFIVKRLVSIGHDARQEVVISEEVGQHWYPAVVIGDEEIIVDSAWQQFLPKNRQVEGQDLPAVLIGSRGEVMNMAMAFGVPQALMHIWEARTSATIPVENQRFKDQVAADAALQAEENGAWEKFMAS